MIIDASVAFKWIFHEAGSDAAAALIGREDLRAPYLLLAEIGNGLWKQSRRGELGDRTAYTAQLGIVASLVSLVPEQAVIPRALDIALMLDHAIYDCIYLALAESEDDILISADRKFVEKVAASPLANRTRLLV